jgi:O-antigen ligase
MFWLGSVLARDILCVQRLFKMLAAVGTALALITIIQNKTGILLFGSARYDASLASASNFSLLQGGDVYRLGSFFVNPDWNGAFFATILFIPLGLLIASNVLWEKILYLLEACIILPALLFTYSVGSWLSAGIGIVVFVVLLGHMRYRLWITAFLAAMTGILLIWFPDQVALLLQHGEDPSVILLRSGAWKTAIHIMQTFPLTGIGLGLQIYMLRAEPYRVPEQHQILAHPHNSYLELGAMAGIPVLVLFVALVLLALCLALRTWAHGDGRQRSLLAGGMAAVIALSVNSLSVNVWTLPPLAAFGWLILGIASSPLLIKSLTIKSLTNQKEMLTERHCDE